MKKNKLLIIALVFMVCCNLTGGLLGVYLIRGETGGFDYDLAGAVVVGTAIGLVFYFIAAKLSKKRNGNVPEVDERSIMLLKRYFMITLYVILLGSGAALIVVYSMGIHLIETGLLIVCLGVIYIVVILGAFVIKRL